MDTKHPLLANNNIHHLCEDPDKWAEYENDVRDACKSLLAALRIDTINDPNTLGTADRMAKMYLHELMRGRYVAEPDLSEFPNTRGLDQLYTVGPVQIRSLCSHHMLPFVGYAWMGILPDKDGNVLGLSKFARLADWIFCRPQIQEEATIMLADLIEEKAKPAGLALVVKAQHMCMTIRGVKEPESFMTTSVMRGKLREEPALRAEFFSMIDVRG